MDPAFKKIAAAEIDEFKAEYRARFPGRSVDEITDEDLLREVMNTIGKKDRLGEQVRCVVSVSMLTEGWDANTVTHILGVRAFGTQLLCEQVVGRGLRRVSYEPGPDGHFAPEYAEVYGVPFSFLPTSGQPGPIIQKEIHRVRALPERSDLELTFPRLLGYRYDLPTARLTAEFTPDSTKVLATDEVPVVTVLDPIVGESIETNLDDLKLRRPQEVAFRIAKRVLDTYFRAADDAEQPWLFPQLLAITERWLAECVVLKDHAFPQMLLIAEWEHDAADRIHRAIVRGTDGRAADHADPAALRPDRLDPLRRLHDDQAGLRDRAQPPQLPGAGLGLGGEARPGPRRDGRGGRLRQEPGPQLQGPVHVRGRGRQLRARPHRPDRRRRQPSRSTSSSR